MNKKPWSWVHAPKELAPERSGRGRYVRPLAVRDEVILKAVGAEVRRLAIANNENTRTLASKLNVSQATVANVQNGNGILEVRFLLDLAEVFGLPATHFIEACLTTLQEEKAKYEVRNGQN